MLLHFRLPDEVEYFFLLSAFYFDFLVLSLSAYNYKCCLNIDCLKVVLYRFVVNSLDWDAIEASCIPISLIFLSLTLLQNNN